MMAELKSDTPIALDDKLKFRVDLADVHLFDPVSDRALA